MFILRASWHPSYPVIATLRSAIWQPDASFSLAFFVVARYVPQPQVGHAHPVLQPPAQGQSQRRDLRPRPAHRHVYVLSNEQVNVSLNTGRGRGSREVVATFMESSSFTGRKSGRLKPLSSSRCVCHTAGTCSATVGLLKKWGTKKIIVIGVVGSIPGTVDLHACEVTSF